MCVCMFVYITIAVYAYIHICMYVSVTSVPLEMQNYMMKTGKHEYADVYDHDKSSSEKTT